MLGSKVARTAQSWAPHLVLAIFFRMFLLDTTFVLFFAMWSFYVRDMKVQYSFLYLKGSYDLYVNFMKRNLGEVVHKS